MFAFFASLILRFGTSVIIRMVLKKKLRIQQKEAEQRAAVEAYRRRQEELRKAEEEQEIQERAEQERAREEQEREKAEKKERKRQAQQQERERHEQIMQEQEIQERAEQERAREEQEREKAEKKERKRQAQQQERERQEQRDRERDEELKRHFEEKLDEERRERKIGEKKWDTKIKYLNQVIQIGIEYCKQILPRGRSTCPSTGKHHCRCPKCQNQSSFQFLPNFALSGVDEEELHSIFNESFLPLQAAEFPEHPKYADSVALLELPDQLPCGFEADMLSMVMMAMNGVADNEVQCLDIAGFKDSNRAQVNTLFELLDQLPDDFEEDMESLDQIPSDFDEDIFDKSDHSFGAAEFSEHPKHGNNITLLELPEQLPCGSEDGMLTALNGATEAKEEGNGHFNAQNFEQAIKCYTKSIDQTPTAVAYANRAMAYLKVNNFTEAEKDCTKALDIDGKYFKAYARRAKARIELRRNLRGASGDVNAALELQPNCQEMKELRDELDQMLG